MNIELRFLQKAIADKNYISFSYENKSYKNIKPLKLDVKIDFLVIKVFLSLERLGNWWF
jgi:predicted DNA-binding transcriptional regulator YafY